MGKYIVEVEIGWEYKNFTAGWGNPHLGAIVATGKDLSSVKSNFEESLRLHIDSCIMDGDAVPEELRNGDYIINYNLDTAALLQDAERYTTLSAISRVSGINQRLLSHYANGVKKPLQRQRERIVNGLHVIGTKMLSLS